MVMGIRRWMQASAARSASRAVALGTVLAAGLTLAAGQAAAQAWPSKPVRLVVPFPAGGSTDVVGRVVAQELSLRLGQQVVVDNRPGASGTVGSEAAARMPADGYTLLLSNVGSQGVGPALFPSVKYNTMADFTHIGMIGTFTNVVLVNTGLPVKTVGELVALAKKSNGKLSYATSGHGSTNHFLGELFNHHAGVKIVHVPYKGSGPALNDLIGKQIDMMYDSLPSAAQHIKSGTVRAIGMASAERVAAFAEVPTLKESGLGKLVISNWFGLSAPARVPPEVVARLSTELKAVLSQPATVARLAELGLVAQSMTPEQFSSFVAADLASWVDAVRETGIKVD